MGPAKYFLGVEVNQSKAGISLSQVKFTIDMIEDACLTEANTALSPFAPGYDLTTSSREMTKPDTFRKIVGRLLYLGFTRPGISFATQQLSQYMQEPQEHHMQAAIHVLKYLKGTIGYGLFYYSQTCIQMQWYFDSDLATCKISRKSITGYCITIGSSLVSWKSKKQSTVSRSTAKAEYRSMCTAACELKWISYILQDLKLPINTPLKLYYDNDAAVAIVRNPVFHERTKHIEIDCHIVRNLIT